MVFTRGQQQDFYIWAQLGNRGWSYEDVLPIFRDMEDYEGEADEDYRGRGCVLKVNESIENGPLYEAIMDGAVLDGIAMSQTTIRHGRRMSTAYCCLYPAKDWPNLKVQTHALTEKALFDGNRCAGVRYSVDGEMREAKAARELLISAGAINSPQLLELSGIG